MHALVLGDSLLAFVFTPQHVGDDGADSIPFQLQRLFGLLQLTKQRAVSTKASQSRPGFAGFSLLSPLGCCRSQELTASFGWDRGEAFQQNDVQEVWWLGLVGFCSLVTFCFIQFCRVLFDAIERSFSQSNQSNLHISRLFSVGGRCAPYRFHGDSCPPRRALFSIT